MNQLFPIIRRKRRPLLPEDAPPVTVGNVGEQAPIEIYPINYTLTPNGDTRQFLVRKLLAGGDIVNLPNAADGTRIDLGAIANVRVEAGDVLEIETPGGGAWGVSPGV